jgi:adenine-specific DNA methylase
LIASLLPDPETAEERRKLCEKIGGKVVQRIEKKKMPNGRTVERIKEETEGGILHWKRETENADDLEWFRQEIRKVYGGRAPRVLDPFAGGGAIPLEAMRLGCEVTAVDINPVAWFILKCTLEYPQKLAGKTHPLPDFILEDEDFMAAFYKAHPHLVGKTKRTKKQTREFENDLFMKDKSDSGRTPRADLAWHVRAWGKWVLDRARRELARFYPTYADFEPLKPGKAYEKQPMRLVPLKDDGTPDIGAMNAEFSAEYLADPRNPRWVVKPTLAYLWARTVTCKNCRATVPLLKTRWLCKKANKRVLLTMEPNPDKTGVIFGIESDVPVKGGNAAQKREHDKRLGEGTMSRAGAKCPCCATIATMEDLRIEGKARRIGDIIYAVMFADTIGKSFRLPTECDRSSVSEASKSSGKVFSRIPFGPPTDPMPDENALGMRAPKYGYSSWNQMFSERQLVSLGTLARLVREAFEQSRADGTPSEFAEGISAYLACVVNKIADYNSAFVAWQPVGCKGAHTFERWAIPMKWDFTENNILDSDSGGIGGVVRWVTEPLVGALGQAVTGAPPPTVIMKSSVAGVPGQYDLIVTDPPYYDAIPYSDCMDFFYVWLRRMLHGLTDEWTDAFNTPLSPKWDKGASDGELIDDANRHDRNATASRRSYEDGMSAVFRGCNQALVTDGRLVIVFAHKDPEAWETLVTAIIVAGFVVDGSWPIQTEMVNRTRSISSAALASSVWLVCKKRPATSRPGWDNKVMEEMRANIATRLSEFWDAGIRGPDFVWAATGPALEAYSKHPVVKKANDPGKTMEVGEFLSQVRRMVVDFVVGQVLTGDREGADLAAADRMDAQTAYYLLHRHDFGLEDAPSGACILYATACGLSDSELESTWDILVRTGGSSGSQDDDEENEDADPDAEADPDSASDSGSKVKLKTWAQRKHKSMGYEAPGGQPVPLIDRIHRLMHLWRAGDVLKVDEYLDEHGLRRQELFRRLLQSLIELSRKDRESQELQTLESLSNHVQAKGATPQATLAFDEEN